MDENVLDDVPSPASPTPWAPHLDLRATCGPAKSADGRHDNAGLDVHLHYAVKDDSLAVLALFRAAGAGPTWSAAASCRARAGGVPVIASLLGVPVR
jgi:hypothetical protein